MYALLDHRLGEAALPSRTHPPHAAEAHAAAQEEREHRPRGDRQREPHGQQPLGRVARVGVVVVETRVVVAVGGVLQKGVVVVGRGDGRSAAGGGIPERIVVRLWQAGSLGG